MKKAKRLRLEVMAAILSHSSANCLVCDLLHERIQELEKEIERLKAEAAPRRRKLVRSSLVYLIRQGEFYKIGKTSNWAHRLESYKTHSAIPFDVILVIECPDASTVEAYLHARFAGCRISGEWFKLSESELKWIQEFAALADEDRQQYLTCWTEMHYEIPFIN